MGVDTPLFVMNASAPEGTPRGGSMTPISDLHVYEVIDNFHLRGVPFDKKGGSRGAPLGLPPPLGERGGHSPLCRDFLFLLVAEPPYPIGIKTLAPIVDY